MNQNINPDMEQLGNNIANGFKNLAESVWRFGEIYRDHQTEIKETLRSVADSIASLLSELPKIAGAIALEIKAQHKAAEELVKAQFVSFGWQEKDFVAEVLSAGDAAQINRVLEKRFCKEDNSSVAEIAGKCCEHELMKKYTYIFEQCLGDIQKDSYNLAIMGLCVIMDGLLSEISLDVETSWIMRAKAIKKRINKQLVKDCNILDRGSIAYMVSLWSVCEIIDKTFGAFFDFSGEEPDFLNRNWIMHGRTTRANSRLDFLKVLRLLYGLLLLSDLIQEDNFAAQDKKPDGEK